MFYRLVQICSLLPLLERSMDGGKESVFRSHSLGTCVIRFVDESQIVCMRCENVLLIKARLFV